MRSNSKFPYIASVCVGILITLGFTYSLHFNPRWYGNNGPGVGKLPRVIVLDYMKLAYDKGQGAAAARAYFAPKVIDHHPGSIELRDGEPIRHEIRQVIAEGLVVAVYHRVEAARGQPAIDVLDVFRTGAYSGRIAERQRFILSAPDGNAVARIAIDGGRAGRAQ
ncbi:hypothetical protein [Cupriavidus taiwanensis]|uniref:hypothetical protein n=1 Tax=Cupriavidus taiwanensis TaxID=164546 RepID=UPI0020C6F849|nr:hypothetical protein [Cupriavidus taiwanensis]